MGLDLQGRDPKAVMVLNGEMVCLRFAIAL